MVNKWKLVVGFCLAAGLCGRAVAALHDFGTPAEGKTLSYFYMQQLSYAYPTSAIGFDIGIEKDRCLEISLLGYRSAYIITDSSYQLSLLAKQKIMEGGPLSFTGIVGLGGLYNSSAGFSTCGNLGGILGFGILPELKISAPVVASIFSDGILMDYSGGLSFKPFFLGGKEIILGGKGTFMIAFDASSGGTPKGFQNSFYGLVGVRTTL